MGEQFCVKVVAHGDGKDQSRPTKTRRNLERFDIVLTVLLAGWVPSILMLLVSYTTLKKTLESKILRDRQTFVQLIGHLVDDDLASTASIISYYQTLPDMERLFTAPNPQDAAQQWIAAKFFSYPRIDGMFIAPPTANSWLTLRPHPIWRASRFIPRCGKKAPMLKLAPTFRPFTGGQLMVAWSLTSSVPSERATEKPSAISARLF